jgi:hypothetical protein
MGTVMPRRAAIIAFVALLLFGLGSFWFLRSRSAAPQLQAKVIAYPEPIEGPTDVLLAETKFQFPGDWSLADPRLEVRVETSAGWQRNELVMVSSTAPLNLHPGGQNCVTIVLPSDTVRWRLLLSGKEAGLRAKFFDRLSSSTGLWARDSSFRLRPFWLWLGRLLPNSPGRSLEFESNILPVHSKGPFLAPHNYRAALNAGLAFCSLSGATVPARVSAER